MSKPVVYPPYGNNTSTCKDGLILLPAILNIVISLLALPFTLFRKGKVLGWSDVAACSAVVLNIVETIPLFLARGQGLGTTLSLLNEDQRQNAQYLFIAELLYIFAIGAHKCWVILFAWRLAKSSYMSRFNGSCIVAMSLTLLWTIGSVLAVMVHCGATEIFPPDLAKAGCPAQPTRWLVICILDAVTDAINFVLISWLIFPLQIELTHKTAIIFSFLVKLGCIPHNVAHFLEIRSMRSSADPGIAIVEVIIWQNAQLGWAALSAAAPSMLWMRNSFELIEIDEDEEVIPSIFGSGPSSSGANSRNSNNKSDHSRHSHRRIFSANSKLFGGRSFHVPGMNNTEPSTLQQADQSTNESKAADYQNKRLAVAQGQGTAERAGSEVNLIQPDTPRFDIQ